MQRDSRQAQHVEAGPLWFRVKLLRFVHPAISDPLGPRAIQYAAIRQPVTAAKVARAATTAFGTRLGAHDTSDLGGVLLGKYKIAGSFVIQSPGWRTRREAGQP